MPSSSSSFSPNPLNDLERQWEESRQRLVEPHKLPPGLHVGIAFEDYCRIPAINFSSLRTAKQSLAHYRYAPAPEDNPAFRFGSLIHCGKLEPDEFDKRYIVLPDREFVEQVQQERAAAGEEPYASPKSTKAYKQRVATFLTLHPGKQEVSSDWFDDMKGILTSLAADPLCQQIFAKGTPEVTAVGVCPVTGEHLKARIDFLVTDPGCPYRFADLKTTDDPFSWSPDKFDYHIQAAFYTYVYGLAWRAQQEADLAAQPARDTWKHFPPSHEGMRDEFVFAVLEKRRPYTVLSAPISRQAREIGAQEAEFLLQRVAEAVRGKRYPRLHRQQAWELNRWYRPMEFPLALYHQAAPTPPTPSTVAKTAKPRSKPRSKPRRKRG